MTRIFSDGFELGFIEVSDWLNLSGLNGCSISSTRKRSGNFSFELNNAVSDSCKPYILIDEIDELYLRIALNKDRNYTAPYIKFGHGTTELVRIYLPAISGPDAPGPLEASVGGSKVATGTITGYLEDTWWLLEIHVKIADANGIIQVKVDNTLDIDYEGDTKPGADTTIDRITFGNSNSSSLFIDDFAINDTNGDVDKSWCGDGHILLLLPNADGDNIDLTGSDDDQVNNYAHVDEVPASGADYVKGVDENDYDLYECQAQSVPEDHVITRIWPESVSLDHQAGSIRHIIKTNDTEYEDDEDIALGYAFGRVKGKQYTVNPNTGEPWTVDELDAIQVGIKIK